VNDALLKTLEAEKTGTPLPPDEGESPPASPAAAGGGGGSGGGGDLLDLGSPGDEEELAVSKGRRKGKGSARHGEGAGVGAPSSLDASRAADLFGVLAADEALTAPARAPLRFEVAAHAPAATPVAAAPAPVAAAAVAAAAVAAPSPEPAGSDPFFDAFAASGERPPPVAVDLEAIGANAAADPFAGMAAFAPAPQQQPVPVPVPVPAPVPAAVPAPVVVEGGAPAAASPMGLDMASYVAPPCDDVMEGLPPADPWDKAATAAPPPAPTDPSEDPFADLG
jgi:hypothetical protein